MAYLIEFIDYLLWLYIVIVFIWAIMSWLIAFNVVNTYNPVVRAIVDFLYRVTEPALRPIRRVLPDLGGLDISPVILFFIILFIRQVVIRNLLDYFGGPAS
jgi:YggT family protein